MEENERINFFINKIKGFYPGIEKEVEKKYCTTKCWDEDEWAKGAYHMFEPGQMMTLIPHITYPEGRVFFAGDHTSGRPGWMEGEHFNRDIELQKKFSVKNFHRRQSHWAENKWIFLQFDLTR